MRFTKMHGIGNDYVYVNCFEEAVSNPHETARFISDRHFGIGSDGLILIKPSEIADFEMDMYNSDGSSGAMCGNGIRCVAKYVYDYGLTDSREITVNTGSGIKTLNLTIGDDGKVNLVRVNMGHPALAPHAIPVITDSLTDSECDAVISLPLVVDGTEYSITCVSMGNPHAVVYLNEISTLDLEHIGPLFETNSVFPDRTNTEFIKIIDRNNIEMRVWERGAGETMACGTGACATTVSSVLNGLTDNKVTVHLLGGDLHIEWDQESGYVYMTGPAATVFDGEISLPF